MPKKILPGARELFQGEKFLGAEKRMLDELRELKSGQEEFVSQVREKTLTLVIVAFGLVAANMWTEAIKAWLKPFLSASDGGALSLTAVAVVITGLAVLATILLSRLGAPKEPAAP